MPKSYSELLPSVERRLSAWISLADRRKSGVEPQRFRPTVTISRRFGCEAFPLSERLKELFDAATGETWNIFDKALLERVCHDEHLSRRLLDDLGGRSRAGDSLRFVISDHISHADAFRSVAKHLLQVAKAGNAIIVGRGGAIIAGELPNCYHFRLDASEPFRIASVMRRLELSEKEATRMVREHDTMREAFIENCLQTSVSDLAHYHAIYNQDRSSIDQIARSITTFVATSWTDKSYFKAAVDAGT